MLTNDEKYDLIKYAREDVRELIKNIEDAIGAEVAFPATVKLAEAEKELANLQGAIREL